MVVYEANELLNQQKLLSNYSYSDMNVNIWRMKLLNLKQTKLFATIIYMLLFGLLYALMKTVVYKPEGVH